MGQPVLSGARANDGPDVQDYRDNDNEGVIEHTQRALPHWVTPRVPGIDQWNIILTNRCNLKCISCSYPDQRPFRFVRRETIGRLLPPLLDSGLTRVMLTGGEPCMHPEFDEIVTELYEAGLALTLVTNGTYVKKKLSALRGRLARLIISLDSDDADGYRAIRGANAFEHLTGLPALVRQESPGTNQTLCILTQRRNFRHLPEFVELAAGLGVDQVSPFRSRPRVWCMGCLIRM